jgi:hypothetical protein
MSGRIVLGVAALGMFFLLWSLPSIGHRSSLEQSLLVPLVGIAIGGAAIWTGYAIMRRRQGVIHLSSLWIGLILGFATVALGGFALFAMLRHIWNIW